MSGLPRRSALSLLAALVACSGTRPPVKFPTDGVPGAPQWQPFSQASFETAAHENKLIVLSVQARWCHWCHVMNARTYADPRVLELLASGFVVVRVDQDGRPDLASRYANWGWPATVILSPAGRELIKLRGNQPPDSFLKTLRATQADYRAGRVPAQPTRTPQSADLDALQATARTQLDNLYDEEDGGWGERQKYPFAAPVLYSLWRAALDPAGPWGDRAAHTLAGHAQLIDPVAGGMFQYSLDDVWTAPHFEKIAAIQAGNVEAFVAAYRLTGERTYLQRAEVVARYVATTLHAPEGFFFASQDADVGRVGDPGHMSGGQYYALDAGGRARVSAPDVDTHLYADLNGRCIAALAELGSLEPAAPWRNLAVAALVAVDATLRGSDGLYEHGQGVEGLFASDQVQMLRALIAVYEVTADPQALARARETADALLARFTAESGALRSQESAVVGFGDLAQIPTPLRLNGEAAQTLVRLAIALGEPSYRDSAQRMLQATAEMNDLRSQGRKIGELLLALQQLRSPGVKLLLVAKEDDDARALQKAAARVFAPEGLRLRKAPGETEYPYPGRPVLYACSESACSAPISEPNEVASGVAGFLASERSSPP